MVKFKLLLAVIACTCAICVHATSWTGSAPASGGKYYLYNVGAQKFLAHGDQWGYHALKDEVGLEFELVAVSGKENTYQLKSSIGLLKAQDDGMYVDGNTTNVVEWSITAVSGSTYCYIQSGDKFLGAGTGRYFELHNDGESDDAHWMLITLDERNQMLADKKASDVAPLDISYKLTNNSTAWGLDGVPLAGMSLQNVNENGTFRDKCAEAWTASASESWDYKTELTGLPQGKYVLYVTGFYRDGASSINNVDAYNRYKNGNYNANAQIYITQAEGDAATVPVQSIGVGAGTSLGGDEHGTDDYKYPNNVTAACYYFFNDRYPEQAVEGSVGADGKLTIGIKVASTIAENWLCIDKVRLEYFGPEIPVTGKIQNPEFNTNGGGWEGNPTIEDNVGESFGQNFNIYQDITGLEAGGVYKISLQGFVRESRSESAGGTYSAADVARNVRVVGAENLSSKLYAQYSTDGTNFLDLGANSLLSIFDEEFGDVPATNDYHTSILPCVPGSRSSSNASFELGAYSDNTLIIQLPQDVTHLRIGIKNGNATDRTWTCFDNVKIYRMYSTLLETLQEEWTDRSAEARAIMHSAEYANVPTFSQEYTDLLSTINTDVSSYTTAQQYYALLDQMRPRLNAFKASKYWYDRFKGVYDAAKALGITTSNYDTEGHRITAATAEAAIHALVVAMDGTMNNSYGDVTDAFIKGWTVQEFGTAKGEHWNGTSTTEYRDVYNAYTTRTMSQTVTLPPGDYVLKVASRATAMDRVSSFTVTLGTKTVYLPTAGNTAPGMTTGGAADYTSGVHGWELRYVALTVPEGSEASLPLTITYEHAAGVNMWASVAEVQLLAGTTTLGNVLEFYAEKVRQKIVEIDKAYYGAGPNGQFEEHVSEIFKTKETVDTYDVRDTYTYNGQFFKASAASTSIGLVNFYKQMHGVELSAKDYVKAYLVMQTKIDKADDNAALYVYTRRALLRAQQFESQRGDVYTVAEDDMNTFTQTLSTLETGFKTAIEKVRGMTDDLNSKDDIIASYDQSGATTGNWILPAYRTSTTYQKVQNDLRQAVRTFISKITVKENEQLELTAVFLYNPNFDYNNPYGWTDNGSTRPHNCNTNTFAAYLDGADVTTTYVNHYAEYYQYEGLPGAINDTYNSFQTITGLPQGAYKLTATGSYRHSTIGLSAQERANGGEVVLTELYASGTHMGEVQESYEETVVKTDEGGNPMINEETGEPETEVVTKTRTVQRLITDTDRSIPLYSLYTRADETAATEGIDNNNHNTVYGAAPYDFNNYMPVVTHYENNTVMFGVTATDGSEDVTVGVRNNTYNYQGWAVVDNFRLYYISPNIVIELQKEWANRVAEAQAYYDAHTSPQGSVYGVALANYLAKSYNPTSIPVDDLEIGEGVVLDGAEINELKYNLALRRLHIALNDYEAATYWFDELERANRVARSFPYEVEARNGRYDALNVMRPTAVTSTMTMVQAREAAHSVRAQADGLFGEGKYYDRTTSLGALRDWTAETGDGYRAIAVDPSDQKFSESSFVEPAGCSGLNSWKFNISKTVTLPKGLYIFKVAARRSGGVSTCELQVSGNNVGTMTAVTDGTFSQYHELGGDIFTAGMVTMEVPRTYSTTGYSGDTGYGIAADGSTSYDGGKDKGWQWEYVPFAVSKACDVTFTIHAESQSLQTWASFADAQLLQGPVPLYIDGESSRPEGETGDYATWDLEPCYANATANRSIAANGKWSTLVLPFAFEVQDGWDVQYMYDQDPRTPQDHVTVYFTRSQGGEDFRVRKTTTAGKPYIIMPQTNITEISEDRVDVVGASTPVETTDVVMTGTLTHHDVANDGWSFYISGNNFWRVASAGEGGVAVPMKPLRAYFSMNHSTASRQALLNFITDFGGDPTGIDGVDAGAAVADGPVYDLQGVRQARSFGERSLKPGVYVVGGRKVIVNGKTN